MPIYEYICNKCHANLEMLVRRADDPIGCPTCGSDQVTLQFSVFGFKTGNGNGAYFSASRAGGCGCGAGACGCSCNRS